MATLFFWPLHTHPAPWLHLIFAISRCWPITLLLPLLPTSHLVYFIASCWVSVQVQSFSWNIFTRTTPRWFLITCICIYYLCLLFRNKAYTSCDSSKSVKHFIRFPTLSNLLSLLFGATQEPLVWAHPSPHHHGVQEEWALHGAGRYLGPLKGRFIIIITYTMIEHKKLTLELIINSNLITSFTYLQTFFIIAECTAN